MPSLLFVGLKGSGKSLIGQAYALQSAQTFVDVDEQLFKLAIEDGLEISDIRNLYRSYGVRRFHYYEAWAMRDIAQQIRAEYPTPLVISGGGGILENRAARRQIQLLIRATAPKRGNSYLQIAYLKRDSQWLYDQYQREGLPATLSRAYPERQWNSMVRRRCARYRHFAHIEVALGTLPLPQQLPQALHLLQEAQQHNRNEATQHVQ